SDGVGTKLEIARLVGRLDTVGIDLVAMRADGVPCTGAEPLLFLDYLATGRVVPEEVATIVRGVAEGCRRAGCALLGGETAEHPGTMEPGRFDLAGFCVGLVEESRILGRARVREGDVVVGLASSGLHSNGYALVRAALLDRAGYRLEEEPPRLGRPLVVALAGEGLLNAAAHVTGGGIEENLPRCLPEGLGAEVEWGTWPVPPIFGLVREAGEVPEPDMRRTFNMGIGMALVVAPEHADLVLERASTGGTEAFRIGRVVAGGGVAYR